MVSKIVNYHTLTREIAVLESDGEFWIGGYSKWLTHQNGEPLYYFLLGYFNTLDEAITRMNNMTSEEMV